MQERWGEIEPWVVDTHGSASLKESIGWQAGYLLPTRGIAAILKMHATRGRLFFGYQLCGSGCGHHTVGNEGAAPGT